MTNPDNKINSLFTASGCLTTIALEKLASGGLSPAEAKQAKAHIAGCELCSDALDGIMTWQKQNRVSVYVSNEKSSPKSSGKSASPVTFGNKVNHINDRLRNRVKFHRETASVKQKRRIGPVPAWFAVAASIVLFAGIYLILQQNRPSDKGLAEHKQKLSEIKPAPAAADTLIHESTDALAQNKTSPDKEKSSAPKVADRITSVENDIILDEEAITESQVPEKQITEETVHLDEKAVNGIMHVSGDSQVTEMSKKAEQVQAVSVQMAPSANSEKRSMTKAANVEENEETEVFTVVEQSPEFPGGGDKLNCYLAENLHYPAEAREKAISGTVYVQFVIDKTGQISDAKVLRGIGSGCDEEALRVIKAMPRWKPGMQRGKPVKTLFNLPIKFSLE
jgi:TonB family protein